ncbi:MAG: hypothetical protein LLG20_27820 [Acidobacteriales bacterium]|nr:hypothetical protein [Terriglobales bacterium]
MPHLEFAFVTDKSLRCILTEEYAEATRAYEAGAYLGAMVTAGAVAEGLLTWALLTREKEAVGNKSAMRDRNGQLLPIESWNLTSLLLVAQDIKLVGEYACKGSWALKEFRNLIHPCKLLGTSARPDASLALNAITALAELNRSLKERVAL